MFHDVVAVESGVIQDGRGISNSSLDSLQRLLLAFISSDNDDWTASEVI